MSFNTVLSLVLNAVYLPKATIGNFAVYACLVLCLRSVTSFCIYRSNTRASICIPSVNCMKCFVLREIMSFTVFSKMLQKMFTILLI